MRSSRFVVACLMLAVVRLLLFVVCVVGFRCFTFVSVVCCCWVSVVGSSLFVVCCCELIGVCCLALVVCCSCALLFVVHGWLL